MTKKIKRVPNESGQISYDIIKVIFEGDILLKTKRPGEYILAIFPFFTHNPAKFVTPKLKYR